MTLEELINNKISCTIDVDSFDEAVELFEDLDSYGVVWISDDEIKPYEDATRCFKSSGECSLAVRNTGVTAQFISSGTRAMHKTFEPYKSMPNYNFKNLRDDKTIDVNSFEKILLD